VVVGVGKCWRSTWFALLTAVRHREESVAFREVVARGILTVCIAAYRQVKFRQFWKTCRRSGDSFGESYRGSRMSRLGRYG
jgi:hypothetical protein